MDVLKKMRGYQELEQKTLNPTPRTRFGRRQITE
jgi:hypothetical protein